jgi:hypothetical protein
MDFDLETGRWRANFKLFNNVDPSPTPKICGKELSEIYGGTGIFGQRKKEGNSELSRRAVSHHDIRCGKQRE